MAVILLLVVVWGGVGAWWFANRPEGRAADSIGTFRQQLRVLERTGPTTVQPAFRMRTDDLGVFGARRIPMSPAPEPRLAVAARRRQMQRRRREVLYALLTGLGGSLVLGFIPGLSLMWWLSALFFVATVLYVAVLMQLSAPAAAATRAPRTTSRSQADAGRAPRAPRTPGAAELGARIRHLPTPRSAAHPAYMLQRSAN